MGKTRRKTRKNKSRKIQHHHLLLRLEIQNMPGKEDKEKLSHLVEQIIQDIHMKSLSKPHVYYVNYPKYNEGITGIAVIETSHIAFHFWKNPDRKILHTKSSKYLLELDIYTCGTLSQKNVGSVLHHLTQFKPTYADITMLNRNTGLTIERHMHWSSENHPLSWAQWLETSAFH